MNSVERAQQISMMTRPERWTAWPMLPVKRVREGKRPQVGVLVQLEVDRDIRPIIYLRKLNDPVPLRQAPVQEYTDFEGIVDDGWMVT